MILVTGGTGVIGSVLVNNLCKQGHEVRVLTIPGDKFVSRVASSGAEVCYGDIADKATLAGICENVKVVYHLAAIIIASDDSLYAKINVEGTRNIVDEAMRAGVGHFIHISSASVVYPCPTAYSLSKLQSENLVRSSGLHFTVVRPTLVYDTLGGQEFDMFLRYLRAFPVVPFIGSGKALKRPVYAGDIVDGLLRLSSVEPVAGNTYNFSGLESISMIDFARLCLRLMGMEKKPIIRLPVWACILAARIMKFLMKDPPLRWPVIAGVIQDADLDPGEAMKDLGYNPASVCKKLPDCFPRKTG